MLFHAHPHIPRPATIPCLRLLILIMLAWHITAVVHGGGVGAPSPITLIGTKKAGETALAAVSDNNATPALSLVISSLLTGVSRGTTISYTIAYMNTSSASATNVLLTDVLPPVLHYVDGSADKGGNFSSATNTLSWTLSALAPGAAGQVSFKATVGVNATIGSTIPNTASITANEVMTPVMSNTVSATVITSMRGDWWMFQHDPQHSGRSLAIGPYVPMVKWNAKVSKGTPASCSPVLDANGNIYLGSTDHSLYALNADGSIRWAFPTGGVSGSAAIGADGTIYVGSTDMNLYAVNPDGSKKWAYKAKGTVYTPAIGIDGTIYSSASDQCVYACNPDGTQKWVYTNNEPLAGFISIALDGTLYVSSYSKLLAINPTGSLKWQYALAEPEILPIIGPDSTVYLNGSDTVRAINPNGTLKWMNSKGGNSYTSLVCGADGTLYISSFQELYAFTPDGRLKWSYYIGGSSGLTHPIVDANGVIYVGNGNRHLYAINPNGSLAWSYPLPGNAFGYPALGSDGTLFLTSDSGSLLAVGMACVPVLTLANAVTPPAAPTGASLTYSLTCDNIGAGAATGILLTDVLPSHTTYIAGSASNGGTYDADTRTLTWNLSQSTLSVNQSIQLCFQVTVDADTVPGSILSNAANLTYAQISKPVKSNISSFTVLNGSPQPFLTLNKSVSLATAAPGTTITYTLTAGNIGGSAATNVTVTDVLPTNLSYISGSGGSYNAATRTLSWILGTLSSAATKQVTFQGIIDANTTITSNISNTATITSTEVTTPVTSNQTAMAVIPSKRGDWWMYQHDAQHTGRSNLLGPATPTEKWRFAAETQSSTANPAFYPPTFAADGTIYISSTPGQFYALNPDGTCKWSLPLKARFSAVGSDGTVYISSYDNCLYALNPQGTMQWKFLIDSYASTTPVIGSDGTIFIGSASGNLYAIKPNGTQRWMLRAISGMTNPVVGVDGTVYVGSDDSNLYAITPDGTQKWAYTSANHNFCSISIGADGTIYAGTDVQLLALNTDGTLKWATLLLASPIPVIGSDGTIYTTSGSLLALNPNGTTKWHFDKAASTTPPVIGADGTIYVGTTGHLYAVNPNGTQKWVLDTAYNSFYSSTALGPDGTLYASDPTNLYAFGSPMPHLTLTSTDEPASAAPGAVVLFTLIYHNSGTVAATNMQLTDTLPAQLTYIPGSASNGGTCTGNTIAWSINTLPTNTTGSVMFQARIAPDAVAGGMISNRADIASTEVATPITSYCPLTVSSSGIPVLSLSKTVSAETTAPGTIISYTITYANQSASTATDVLLTDTLPEQLSYVPASASGGGVFAEHTLTWSLNTLAPNSSGTVTFETLVKADVAAGKTILNTATISCAELTSAMVSNSTAVRVVASQRGDWWTPRHDQYYTGCGRVHGPRTATIKHKYYFSYAPSVPVFAADGTIYIGADGYFNAMNPDGTYKWSLPINTVGSPSIGTDGTVYVGSDDFHLYAIRPDGTIQWEYTAKSYMHSPITIEQDGTILTTADDEYVYALNPDGTLKWACYTEDPIISPIIKDDDTLYYFRYNNSTYGGELHIVNRDGLPQKVISTGLKNTSFPVLGADGTIYIAGSGLNNAVYAYNPDGSQKWAFLASTKYATFYAPAIGVDGTVYVGSSDKNVYAINPDGTQKWAFPTGGAIASVPSIDAEGIIYVGSNDNKLYAINPDGTQKWCLASPSSAPFINPAISDDGVLYAPSGNCLYAIGDATVTLSLVKSASLTTATPGSAVTYTLAYRNSGSDSATNIILSDTLPAHVTYMNGSASSGGTYSATTRTLAWSLNTLAPNTTGLVTFQVIVDNDIPLGSTISNIARITCDQTVAPVTSNPADITIPANNAPTLDPLANLTINENAGLQTVPLTGISAGDTGQTLTVTATSSNTVLIPTPTVTYTSPNSTGSLTFTPVANQSGTATITVTVQDNGGTANGGVDTTTRTFTVAVNNVNHAPTIDQLPDQTVLENAGPTVLTLTGITAGGEPGQTLTVTALSDTPAIVPDPVVQYTSPHATATLIVQPQPHTYGAATITVTVRDNGGTANGGVDTTTMAFAVTVNYVNDAPTLDALLDQAINENAGLQTVHLTGITPGGIGEEDWQTVTVTASSDNPTLIPAPTVDYTSPDTTGTLTYTPATGASGTAHLTVLVQDDGGTADGGVDTTAVTFTVTVRFVNTAPTLNPLANLTMNENAGQQTVNLTGISAGDADDAGQTLTVTAASSNTGLIPTPTVTYTSPNATGTLTFTPVANQYGTATLTVTVQDNGGTANGGVDTITRSCTVTVNLVNHAPTLDPIADQTVDTEAGLQTLTLTGIGPGGAGEESGQLVTVTATSSNPALIANPTVSGSGATRTLSYRPVGGQNGTVTITVTAKDNGGTLNGGVDTTTRSFTITVVRHQPDLGIRTASESSFTGLGSTSSDSSGQTKTQLVLSTDKAVYYLALRNAGDGNDTLTLTPSGDTTGWAITASTVDALGNVLAPISLTGGWATGTLLPGQTCYVKVEVAWAGPAGTPSTCALTLTVTSGANPAKVDVAKAITTLRRGPDMRVHGSADIGYLGTGIFNLTGLGQTSAVNLTGTSTTYTVRISNVDVVSDHVTVKAPAVPAGWKARYLLQPTNTDITAKITSAAGWTSDSVGPQGMVSVLVVVNPNAYVKLNGSATVTVTATSVNDATNQDVVKAVTTRK